MRSYDIPKAAAISVGMGVFTVLFAIAAANILVTMPELMPILGLTTVVTLGFMVAGFGSRR